jgi:hypothetical protein
MDGHRQEFTMIKKLLILGLLLLNHNLFGQAAGDYRWSRYQSGSNPPVTANYLLSGKNVIYVSKGSGATDTRTGLSKYDPTLPFATVNAAKTASATGDTIQVLPGNYTATSSLAKDGVNWNLSVGATIALQNADGFGLFDDGGAAMTFSVSGYGDLSGSVLDTEFGSCYLIRASNAASNISVVCRDISLTGSSDGECGAVFSTGTIAVNFRYMVSMGGNNYGVWWDNGPMFINGLKITSDFVGISSYCNATPTGDAYYTVDEIVGACAVVNYGSDSTAACWIESKILRQTGGESSYGSVANQGNNRLYVHAQKLFGRIDTTNSGGLLYVTSDKVSATYNGVAGGALLNLSGATGSSRIAVHQWDSNGFTGSMIVAGGGYAQLYQGDYIAGTGANGVMVSSGTLRISDLLINTASGTSTNPITKTGGTLIIDRATLVASGTQLSISATSAQNVVIYGAQANTAVSGTVTQQVGTVIVNSAVQ